MKRWVAGMMVVGLCLTCSRAARVLAQPSAAEVLSDAGFSTDDREQVLAGHFVTRDVRGVSDKDLSIAMSFLVKAAPAAVGTRLMSGDLVSGDSQVKTWGTFRASGSLADLSLLRITPGVVQSLLQAAPGESLNLSSGEIAAFTALQGTADPQQAAEQALRTMLLARFQAYRSAGLAAIAPYARSDGGQTDVGKELREASEALPLLRKYLPAFQNVLVGYPQATIAGLEEKFHWVSYDIDGSPTFALTHILDAPDGDARVIAQRQYYVSTGYNAEQAVAGLLPVQEGTLVVYLNHTFTDQVAGFGGSMKRSIGRHLMANKLKAAFEQERSTIAQ